MRQSPGLHYLTAAAGLGLITFYGSENLFWSAPMPGMTPLDLLLTAIAYSVCAAAVLSAVLITGLTGWRALFLGGALLGWLVEGVIVGTAYEAFPLQLVWTPMAWHALITGVGVVGLCRAGVGWPVWQQVAALAALGLVAALWAQFWPLERGAMPGIGATLVYLTGVGLLVPLGNLMLDRAGWLQRPPAPVLWIAPGLLLLLWVAQSYFAPSPVRLSVPVLVLVTLWIMHRLGAPPPRDGVSFGEPAPLWRHGLFLLVPLVAGVVAVPGWRLFQGLGVNQPFALTTGLLSLGLWFWLMVRALRQAPARRLV